MSEIGNKLNFTSYLRNMYTRVPKNKTMTPKAQFVKHCTTREELVEYFSFYKNFSAEIYLSELYAKIKTLNYGMTNEYIEEATVSIFLMLLYEPRITKALHHAFNMKYGCIEYLEFQRIYMIVKSLGETLDIEKLENELLHRHDNKLTHYICFPLSYDINYCIRTVLAPLKIPRVQDFKVVKEFSMAYRNPNEKPKSKKSKRKKKKSHSRIKQGNNIEKVDKNLSKFEKQFSKILSKCPSKNELHPDMFKVLADIILNSDLLSENLAMELFDILGPQHIDLVECINTNLKKIKTLVSHDQEATKPVIVDKPKPSFGTQVVMETKKEKELKKRMRKLQRKNQDVDIVEETRDSEKGPTMVIKRRTRTEVYPNVYDSAANVVYNRKALPSDAEYIQCSYGIEIRIPAPEAIVFPKDKLVPVSAIDEPVRIIFNNLKYFNTIQSKVFPTVYHTNENMLICAPTGAGKTNVALLAIARTILESYSNGVIGKDTFKIVYVSPMKALASEITETFAKKLKPLGILVRELTGDMQLTKQEINDTHVIVTTPEKWDVITRKGISGEGICPLLRLIIFDEIHLLYSNRGSVIEALVARTLRLVETTQTMIRIIGLSATLPSYIDVARFLNVNLHIGLFFFDGRFRPVPLTHIFCGISGVKVQAIPSVMDEICYEKMCNYVTKGHQVLIFVHSRPMTTRTATAMLQAVRMANKTSYFMPQPSLQTKKAIKDISRSSNSLLPELLENGFGVHHAGLERSDRNKMEECFRSGIIKVLVTTATLAWGVNLPAHAVIIKGTDIYDPSITGNVDVGILDVLQIFGRAGRPQFDSKGTGIIITTSNKIDFYLQMINGQISSESHFLKKLTDNLNAEIATGTVSNVEDGIKWLRYTFLYQRLNKNPLNYGLTPADIMKDTGMYVCRYQFIDSCALQLDKAEMVRYNASDGSLVSTELGRIASQFYIDYETVTLFNTWITPHMLDVNILSLMCQAHEFNQIKMRTSEEYEIDDLESQAIFKVPAYEKDGFKKVNVLLQAYICNIPVKDFTLISDLMYIIQNASRIAQALFQIALSKTYSLTSANCLAISKAIEKQQWGRTPLRQFPILKPDIIHKIEKRKLDINRIRDEDARSIASLVNTNVKGGEQIKQCAMQYPILDVSCEIHPVTRSVLRVKVKIQADFKWNDHVHGKLSQQFLLWVENIDNCLIYYHEYFYVPKRNVVYGEPVYLMFTVPLIMNEDQLPQYQIRVESTDWIGAVTIHQMPTRSLILPPSYTKHTELLYLQPLPLTVLHNKKFASLYKFTHFNPIQSQVFYTMFNTNQNVLIGSPTGSGKTIMAEMAIFRLFTKEPQRKIVYIAPLKALVRERVNDWKQKFKALKKSVIEITGDVSAHRGELQKANIIITTPEKWDGLSRCWQTRSYVKSVGLIIFDEIHLLGEDRGPVLEVIVSRIRYINETTKLNIRLVGLSTAIANATDIGNWLNIKESGLFNFRPSVRPVSLEVHVNGFPGKFYCPRMNSMNRPTYRAICTHAPNSPALVFVSSRRQTRSTALDLISYLQTDDNPKRWLKVSDDKMFQMVAKIKDPNVKITLPYGVGIHHAGLIEQDRLLIEEMFLKGDILVLVATSTLAWGVNFPAHLVVIKGTEYYDCKRKGYADMPITDILQMIGRAGRPQFDNTGVAVVLVQENKKAFYKKFLFDPFPIESNMLEVLPDHINAELVAGMISNKNDMSLYLTWTFFYQRLQQNPMYYNLPNDDPEVLQNYLRELIDATFNTLVDSGCVHQDTQDQEIYAPTYLGKIASYYYLSYKTLKHLSTNLKPHLKFRELLAAFCNVTEYSEIPVRHSEDDTNREFIKSCRLPDNTLPFDSPHTKANVLLQAHFSRLEMPVLDYKSDLKSVLEQAIRIIEAMLDVSVYNKWFSVTLLLENMMQMIIQGCWFDDSPLIAILNINEKELKELHTKWKKSVFLGDYNYNCLSSIKDAYNNERHEFLMIVDGQFHPNASISNIFKSLPSLEVNLKFESSKLKEPMLIDLYDAEPIHITQDETCFISIRIMRNGDSTKVVHHRYPKPVTENWYLTCGYKSDDSIILFERVTFDRKVASYKMRILPGTFKGRHVVSINLVSSSYVGMDQCFEVPFHIGSKK